MPFIMAILSQWVLVSGGGGGGSVKKYAGGGLLSGHRSPQILIISNKEF